LHKLLLGFSMFEDGYAGARPIVTASRFRVRVGGWVRRM